MCVGERNHQPLGLRKNDLHFVSPDDLIPSPQFTVCPTAILAIGVHACETANVVLDHKTTFSGDAAYNGVNPLSTLMNISGEQADIAGSSVGLRRTSRS